jgi:spermidine/putrescine transport system substrate-binding protein
MSSPKPPQPAQKLTIDNRGDGLPQAILDAFTEDYGVAINYQSFVNTEEAVANIKSGNGCDVVMMDSPCVTELPRSGQLTEPCTGNVPNLRSTSVNFRDLIFNPGHRYGAPCPCVTIGLVARSDLEPNRRLLAMVRA